MIKRIQVPATSANIGCGFDTLGIALNMYAVFTFETINEKVKITGCEKEYANEDNLVYQSYLKGMSFLQKKPIGVHIDIQSKIPLARGLGSSATCVVGGIMGAYALTNTPFDKDAIFQLAMQIEGHLDNVAAAVYGGLCAAFIEGGVPYVLHYPVDERFLFQGLIPDFETKTKDARNILPRMVSYEDALHNLSHINGILYGFTHYDVKMLPHALCDRLHEPYRKTLIHEYEQVKQICLSQANAGFFISGSGSTLMNLPIDEKAAKNVEMQLSVLNHHWKSVLLKVDTCGACLLEEGTHVR